jgi:hypothetical protein
MKLKSTITISSRDASVVVVHAVSENIWDVLSSIERVVEHHTGVSNLIATSGQWVKFVSHLMTYGRATYFDFTGATPRVEVVIAVR